MDVPTEPAPDLASFSKFTSFLTLSNALTCHKTDTSTRVYRKTMDNVPKSFHVGRLLVRTRKGFAQKTGNIVKNSTISANRLGEVKTARAQGPGWYSRESLHLCRHDHEGVRQLVPNEFAHSRILRPPSAVLQVREWS